MHKLRLWSDRKWLDQSRGERPIQFVHSYQIGVPEGLEPLTCGLGNRSSILLSYQDETPHSRRLPGVHEQLHRWLLRIPPGRLGALQGGTAAQPCSSAVD
jgi:hypothetical protein